MRVPQQVWMSGFNLSADAGVSFRIAKSFSLLAEFGYMYAAYSADMPLYETKVPPFAPIMHGTTRVSYLSVGGGVELQF
jgi:hypothetical protein